MKRRIMSLAASAALAAALPTAPLAAQQMLGKDALTWRWDGNVAAGQWARLYSVNGAVKVTASPDGTMHVVAEKRVGEGGDPRTVHFAVVNGSDGVTICALWKDDATCTEDGPRNNSVNSSWRNREQNVTVNFTVQVPNGVRTGANTVNGSIDIINVGGEVRARTVNGGVSVNTRGGPVNARTVNGGIEATIGTQNSADMSFETVNGSVAVSGPADLNADFQFRTVNGSIESRYPITITGKWGPKSAQGTIGRGGPSLNIRTVNGGIRLR